MKILQRLLLLWMIKLFTVSVCTPTNVFHINETIYERVDALFPSEADEDSRLSSDAKEGITFTHGGPIHSRIADISPTSECTSHIVGLTTICLVCKNIAYLLDKTTLSRSNSFMPPETPEGKTVGAKEFTSHATSSYSILLLSSDKERKCIGLSYVNTFDASVQRYQCDGKINTESASYMGNHTFKLRPTVKYVNLEASKDISTNKAILYFDRIEHPHNSSQACGESSAIHLRIADPSGGPAQNKNMMLDFFNDIPSLSRQVAFHEIFTARNRIVAIYSLKTSDGSVSWPKVVERTVNFLNPTSWTFEPIKIEYEIELFDKWRSMPVKEARKRSNMLIEYIDNNMLLIFLAHPDILEIYVCRKDDKRITDCNSEPYYLKDHILKTYKKLSDVTIYGVSQYFRLMNQLKVFLEVKEISTQKTLMSISLIRSERKQDFPLELETDWVIPANTHISSYKDKQIHVVRDKTMECYSVTLNYIRINFAEYYSNRSDGVQNGLRCNPMITLTNSYGQTISRRINGKIIKDYVNYVEVFEEIDEDSPLLIPVVTGIKETTTPLRLEGVLIRGNNLKYKSLDPNDIYLNKVLDDANFEMNKPLPSDEVILKVTLEGNFLIAVSKTDTEERKMYLYKCANDEMMKYINTESSDSPGYKKSIDCKHLITINVNSFVDLAEAKDLKDFLVVRFKSENSVVYYKINKFDYTSIEINLKGYSPVMVWMAQLHANTIIICHYKSMSATPFTLFSLEGENLVKLPEPNIEQFRTSTEMEFKAGSLIEEAGSVYLYLAIAYPKTLTFLKFRLTIDQTGGNVALSKSGSDLFEEHKLDMINTKMCFLQNKLFIVNESVVSSTTLDGERIRNTTAYLVNLANPNLDYTYPLSDFELSKLTEISVVCDSFKNLIIVKGMIDEAEMRKPMTIFLNGEIGNSNEKIIIVLESMRMENCLMGFTMSFVSEICMEPNPYKDQTKLFASRLVKVDSSSLTVFVQHDKTSKKSKIEVSAGTAKKHITIQAITSEGEYPIKVDLDHDFREEIKRRPTLDTKTVKTYDIIRNILKYDYHMLSVRVRSKSKARSTNTTTQSQAYHLNGITLRERISEVKKLASAASIEEITKNKAGDDTKFPQSMDEMVLTRDYMMGLTVTTRYQNLKTWITLYKFNAEDVQKSQFIGNFSIENVCAQSAFDYFMDSKGTTHFVIMVICNKGMSFIQEIHYYNTSGEIGLCLESNKLELSNKPVDMKIFANSTEKYMEYFISVTSIEMTGITRLRFDKENMTDINQNSIFEYKLDIVGQKRIIESNPASSNPIYKFTRFSYLIRLGSSKQLFILILGQCPCECGTNYLKVLEYDPEFEDFDKLPVYDVIPPKKKGFMERGGALWSRDIGCAYETEGEVRCYSLPINDLNNFATFILYHDPTNSTNPVRMKAPAMHYNVPDSMDEFPNMSIIDGYLVTDIMLITSAGKNNYINFYKLPPRDSPDANYDHLNYTYVWYSINKHELFNDYDKDLALISHRNSTGHQLLLINSDKMDEGPGKVYYLRDELSLEVTPNVTEVMLEDTELEFNYDRYLEFVIREQPIPKVEYWGTVFVVGLAVLGAAVLFVLIYCAIKYVRRARMPDYLDSGIDVFEANNSLMG